MKFSNNALLATLLGIGLAFAPAASAQTHLTRICLGWTGGAAGDGYKWVDGNITWNGEEATITYDWAGIGTMSGTLENGILKGTWKQKGSNGGFYFSLPGGQQTKALGQWWSANSDKKHDMTVTTDMSACKKK